MQSQLPIFVYGTLGHPQESLYRRVACRVAVSSGHRVTAWTYMGRTLLGDGRPHIASGDWSAHAAQQQHQIAAWWQTRSLDDPLPTNLSADFFDNLS